MGDGGLSLDDFKENPELSPRQWATEQLQAISVHLGIPTDKFETFTTVLTKLHTEIAYKPLFEMREGSDNQEDKYRNELFSLFSESMRENEDALKRAEHWLLQLATLLPGPEHIPFGINNIPIFAHTFWKELSAALEGKETPTALQLGSESLFSAELCLQMLRKVSGKNPRLTVIDISDFEDLKGEGSPKEITWVKEDLTSPSADQLDFGNPDVVFAENIFSQMVTDDGKAASVEKVQNFIDMLIAWTNDHPQTTVIIIDLSSTITKIKDQLAESGSPIPISEKHDIYKDNQVFQTGKRLFSWLLSPDVEPPYNMAFQKGDKMGFLYSMSARPPANRSVLILNSAQRQY